MGYFTRSAGASAWGVVRPLTREAVTTVLDEWDASYAVDDDGDVGGYWDGHLFLFMVRGADDRALLSVRGRWSRALPEARREEVLALLDGWHHETLWPKAYLRAEDEGLTVHAEVNVPAGRGLALAQLAEVMRCALATTLQLFDHLAEQMPEEDGAGGAAAEGTWEGAAGGTA